ncbi:uncharacterized protein LJ206_014243 isoform 2-T2 [Theristicus caerulescens]
MKTMTCIYGQLTHLTAKPPYAEGSSPGAKRAQTRQQIMVFGVPSPPDKGTARPCTPRCGPNRSSELQQERFATEDEIRNSKILKWENQEEGELGDGQALQAYHSLSINTFGIATALTQEHQEFSEVVKGGPHGGAMLGLEPAGGRCQ